MAAGAKEVRYDRQLRLWGDDGQARLEAARVCLLGASAVGTELLKSLVLPGVGGFTIVDGAVTTGEHVGANFFLTAADIGQPRASAAARLLMELNPSVEGRWVAESPTKLVQNGMSLLDEFSVVIGTELPEKTAAQIAAYLWTRDIAFVLCRAYGLLGYVRVAVREHAVLESHPDSPFDDLRVDRPFAGLSAAADALQLDALDHQQHSHTPYVLLVLKALAEWRRARTDAAFPASYADRKELREVLLAMRRPDERGRVDEENFDEAVNNLTRLLHRTEVPAEVKDVLAHPRCRQLSRDSSKFWIMCSGLREFVEECGVLPVRGSLPDMTADSDGYVKLQEVYRAQALADAERVHELATAAAAAVGVSAAAAPSFDEVAHFCKNAAFVRVCAGRSLDAELAEPSGAAELLKAADAHFAWYVVMRAAERFNVEKLRYPGTNGIPVDLDQHDVRVRVDALLADWHCDKVAVDSARLAQCARELCRYGACELHATAAFVGAVGAQEVIKLVTAQYVPLDNTFIYDAHTGSGASMRL